MDRIRIVSPIYQRVYPHDGVDTPTIPLPHGPKSRLTTEVPASGLSCQPSIATLQMDDLPFERDMTFLDSFHVEAHGGDRAFGSRKSDWDTKRQQVVTYSMVNSPP